jgi:hypothetical protein
MKSEKANKLIEKAISIVDKNGIEPESISKVLMEAREFAKQEEDALVTKSLRLISEYIKENEAFDIVPELEEDEDGEVEEREEMTDEENLKYLLQLIIKSDNNYNRQEIIGYRKELWDAIY